MSKLVKIISIAMLTLTLFAMLIIAEAAGIRVHHAETVKLIHVNQGEPIPARGTGDDPSIPCQNDETPIEHAIHYSAGHVSFGNAFRIFSIPVILSSWNPLPVVHVRVEMSHAPKDHVFESQPAYTSCPNRAPPVIIYSIQAA